MPLLNLRCNLGEVSSHMGAEGLKDLCDGVVVSNIGPGISRGITVGESSAGEQSQQHSKLGEQIELYSDFRWSLWLMRDGDVAATSG